LKRERRRGRGEKKGERKRKERESKEESKKDYLFVFPSRQYRVHTHTHTHTHTRARAHKEIIISILKIANIYYAVQCSEMTDFSTSIGYMYIHISVIFSRSTKIEIIEWIRFFFNEINLDINTIKDYSRNIFRSLNVIF